MAASAHNFKLVSVLTGLLVFTGAGFAVPAKAAPGHVVSTSLCGDAYVLALIPPQRITALSWQADTKLSADPAFLRHKNKGMASAERLARLHPDLVVLGPGNPLRATKAVQKIGVKVLSLNWTESFEGVFDNLRALGDSSGQTKTANTRIKAIKARLTALKTHVPKGPVRILYLTPSGNSAGADVFVDAAIRAAGGINHGATLGIKGWGRVPLEKLTLNPPDLIITSFFNAAYPSIANLRSRHPLLQRVMKNTPTVRIAAKNWICAGPRLINAAEDIAKAMDALAPQETAS